ncbi:hypothetical protein SEA_ZOOMAN_94 [Microbacterium phage Zooman]|nr:hypothetical protein SEA_ZOOMAN_94 [Microbacterium phage Zooman]
MSENEVDLSWAKEQLAGARVPAAVGRGVLALLRAWDGLKFPSDAQQEKAIEIFSKLALDEAVFVEHEHQYAPVMVGFNVQVGNIVRVRSDAFTGDLGRLHNGRVGRVTAKRHGDIIVTTIDDREPKLEMAHYPPSALDIRIK